MKLGRNLGTRGVATALGALLVVTSVAAADGAPRSHDTAPDPDRVIVAFSAGAQRAAEAAVRSEGGRVHERIHGVDALTATVPAHALGRIRRNPRVRYVEADVLRHPQAHGFADAEVVPYGLAMVEAPDVPDAYASPRKVCIIDTGYLLGHVDLPSGSSVTGDSDPGGAGDWFRDGAGHGTHVAGTIAALGGNGVGVVGVVPAGRVQLHIVRVFGDNGLWAYSSSVAAAANRCRDAGAHVINMSLGGTASSQTERETFDRLAQDDGILSVAAAGNDGNTSRHYPASYASVVSVAAVDEHANHASISQRNDQVELAAPGVAVASTVPYRVTRHFGYGGSLVDTTIVERTPETGPGGVTGTLVHGGRCDTSPQGSGFSGAVVLCERGDVSFATKVANVAAGGGVAAVIYNNVVNDPSCAEFAGTVGTSTAFIPAITTSCAVGADALQHLGTSATVETHTAHDTPHYWALSGTSMASPHVAGVAALVWSCNPDWTNVQVRTALQGSAKDLGAVGRDDSFGYGLVRAEDALVELAGDRVCGPPVISGVSSSPERGTRFIVTWTTSQPATSQVTLATGETFRSDALVTDHAIVVKGRRNVIQTYTVTSTNIAGQSATSGPHTHGD